MGANKPIWVSIAGQWKEGEKATLLPSYDVLEVSSVALHSSVLASRACWFVT